MYTWQDIKANIGIWLKEQGCALIHGRGHHLWGDWVQCRGFVPVRSCRSCGTYDYGTVAVLTHD